MEFIGGKENSLPASRVSRMLSSELPQELHFINFVLKMGKYLMCKRTTPKPTHGKEISEKGKSNLQFEDLPAVSSLPHFVFILNYVLDFLT